MNNSTIVQHEVFPAAAMFAVLRSALLSSASLHVIAIAVEQSMTIFMRQLWEKMLATEIA